MLGALVRAARRHPRRRARRCSRPARRASLELDGDGDRIERLEPRSARSRHPSVDRLAGRTHRAAHRRGRARSARRSPPSCAALAMPDARVDRRASTPSATEPAHGRDQVAILLRRTPAPSRGRVARGASGGELSRVMLAIEVVIAGSDPVPTFVFDEVDAGVGGAAAIEIGRRLARLAERVAGHRR